MIAAILISFLATQLSHGQPSYSDDQQLRDYTCDSSATTSYLSRVLTELSELKSEQARMGSMLTALYTKGCTPVWSKYYGSSSLRAVRYRQYTNADDCLSACASGAIPNCVAVDVNNTNPSFAACLAHVRNSSIAVRFSTPGVTQYQLVSGCPGSWTSSGSSCDKQWIKLESQQTTGAPRYLQYNTTDDCLNACLNSVPNCVAADIDRSPVACWLHTNPTLLASVVDSNNFVDQYRSVGGCLNKGICGVVWIVGESGVNSYGAVQQPSYNSVPDCKSYCVSLDGCVAIDFNNVTSTCWVHTDARNLATRSTASGFTQYRLRSICP